ncbi:MAG: alpha/beta hydrolase [Steroidobacteraceae bacterium]
MRGPDSYLESGGAQLRFRDEGEGEAVVFIHGWTLDLEMWDAQAAEFSGSLRVIRFDRRGHGLSGGHPGHEPDQRDLEALLDHLRVARASVVGMSQGARTAMSFALRLPERVASLVLDGPPDLAAGTGRDPEFPINRFRELARTGGLEAFRVAWRVHPLMQLHTGDRAATELVARALARYPGLDLLDEAAPAASAMDERAIGRLQLPVLVITGERDSQARQAAADWLRHVLPQVERVQVAHAGHLPNLDNPGAYAKVLHRFLRRQSRVAA